MMFDTDTDADQIERFVLSRGVSFSSTEPTGLDNNIQDLRHFVGAWGPRI